MKWVKIHLDRFWLCALVIILISLPLISLSCSCGKTETPKKPPISFDVGKATQLVNQTIGAPGGTITVEKPGDPLNGLTVEIPEGAYERAVSFAVSESPIQNFKAKDQAVVLSPLISIDNGANYSSKLIKVKIPVKVPDGYFAMAFLYDPKTGNLAGLPTFLEDDSSLTFITTHFTDSVALAVPESILDQLVLPTNFTPGRDTWNLANAGSYVSPGGYCRGMNLAALYYFVYEKPTAKEDLWKDDNGNGLGPSMKTSDFWRDDKWAIQLCSVAQHSEMTDLGYKLKFTDLEWAESATIVGRQGSYLPGTDRLTFRERQFYQTAFAFWNSGEPQLLAVFGTRDNKLVGHSLICYGKEGNVLYVADPNYPKDKTLRIVYDRQKGDFEPYRSPGGADYPRVTYEGRGCFFDEDKFKSLWAEFRAEGTSRHFPNYSILVTEFDSKGNEGTSYTLDRTNGRSTSAKFLTFTLSAPYEGKITAYRFENRNNPLSASKVELSPGENIIGLHVESKGKTEEQPWLWAGFDWVKIRYEEKDTTTTTPSPKINKINFSLEPSSATIKVDERIIIKTASNVAFSKVSITWETITQGTSTEFPFSTARMGGVTDPDGWKVNRSWGKPGTYTVTFIAYEYAWHLDDKDRIEYGRATATITVVPK